ncbi:MAG: tetratricopeptide repeat protein [Myxococcota bacterium]|nr:tetratricopeptide repeat protein [Myxococcota bacterium]
MDIKISLEANAIMERGHLEAEGNNFMAAQVAYEQAHDLYRQEEIPSGQANALNSLGILSLEKHDFTAAENYFSQALVIYQGLKDKKSEGLLLGNLSNVEMAMGNLDESLEHTRMARDIQASMGDKLQLVLTLGSLGDLLVYTGQHDEAVNTLSQAHGLAQELGHPRLEAFILEHLSNASLDLFHKEEYLKRAQEIYLTHRYEHEYQTTCAHQATIDYRNGNWECAVKGLRNCLAFFEDSAHPITDYTKAWLALVYGRLQKAAEGRDVLSGLQGYYTAPCLERLNFLLVYAEASLYCNFQDGCDSTTEIEQLIDTHQIRRYPMSEMFQRYQQLQSLRAQWS